MPKSANKYSDVTRIIGYLLIATGVFIACNYLGILYFDPFIKGRVVEADTKEPIAGAAVLAVWYTSMPTPGGVTSHYFYSYDTKTDERGNFVIPGRGLWLGTLNPPSLVIYKHGGYSFNYEEKGKKDNRRIFILKKAKSYNERKYFYQHDFVYIPSEVPPEKEKYYREELDKERYAIENWNCSTQKPVKAVKPQSKKSYSDFLPSINSRQVDGIVREKEGVGRGVPNTEIQK